MSHSSHVHVGEHEDADSTKTNKFELIAAVLLGLAGILTASASFQAGLWNGKMSEHYGKANAMATAAAAEKSRAIVEMSRDATVDIQAKQLIMEGDENPAVRLRNHTIAAYLYTVQMSDAGYKAMGFPAEAKKLVKDDAKTPQDESKVAALGEELLDKALRNELTDNANYRNEMLAESKKGSDEADKTFTEGVKAKENGDHFELGDVIFAVSLFFTGISLVFRTRIRWGVILVGGFFLFCGIVYMLTLHWTFS
jgi:hypothetical protein